MLSVSHFLRKGSPDWVSCCICTKKSLSEAENTHLCWYICVYNSLSKGLLLGKIYFLRMLCEGKGTRCCVSTLLCSEALGCACAAWAEAGGCAVEQCLLCTLFQEQNESSPLWVPNPAPSGLGASCLNLLKLVQVASPSAFGLRSAQTGPAALLGLILCLHPHPGSRYHSRETAPPHKVLPAAGPALPR